MCLTAPLTVRMSSQPSLSKSNQAAPKPVYAQARKPDARTGGLLFEDAGSVVHVEIVSFTGELGDEQVFVAVVVEIAGVDAHAPFGFAVSAERGARERAPYS